MCHAARQRAGPVLGHQRMHRSSLFSRHPRPLWVEHNLLQQARLLLLSMQRWIHCLSSRRWLCRPERVLSIFEHCSDTVSTRKDGAPPVTSTVLAALQDRGQQTKAVDVGQDPTDMAPGFIVWAILGTPILCTTIPTTTTTSNTPMGWTISTSLLCLWATTSGCTSTTFPRTAVVTSCT